MDGSNGEVRKNVIFIGLALGMLAAAASQTIVSPALPVIVSELGGVSHYSWVATSALLVSAVTVPMVGKLSDLYGRRLFFIAGLVIFMLGSVAAGAAQDFWWLVGARAIQGLGMGTILPLAQTILGDIVSARERGRYVGYLGGVFGIASVSGPLVGGWVTDNFSWRWLFYINLPLGIAALAFVIVFLHLPHVPRKHAIDYLGFSTLGLGLVAVLLATSWGGTQYPWDSWHVIGLYAVGALLLIAFLINERYAEEPVIPLGLWKNSIFSLSNIANLAVAMGMFGAIYYVPVFAQGVLGVSVTGSGTITIPLTASMILTSIVVGRLITRTGRYKVFILTGTLIMCFGYFLLTHLGYHSSKNEVRLFLVVVGLGLGCVLQTYTLIVQNAVSRENLGVATAATQFSRSVGATIGIAIFGTILTSNMKTEIPRHLPPAARSQAAHLSHSGVQTVLDPNAIGKLPEAVANGIREGLAASIHPLFVVGIPIVAAAFVMSLFIREIPLRTVAFVDEGKRSPTPESADVNIDSSSRDLLLAGIALEYLARRAENANGDYPNLVAAASRLIPAENGESASERARIAAREVMRPLALQMVLSGIQKDGNARENERSG